MACSTCRSAAAGAVRMPLVPRCPPDIRPTFVHSLSSLTNVSHSALRMLSANSSTSAGAEGRVSPGSQS